MTLLLLILGVVLAAAVLQAALAQRSRALSGTAAMAVMGVALLAATAVQGVAKTMDTFGDRREGFSKLTREEAEDQGGLTVGVDRPFSRFVAGQVGRGETFMVLPRKAGAGQASWFQYRLAPKIAVDRIEDADVLIYINDTAPLQRYGLRAEDYQQLEFGPTAGLLRRTRAR